METSNEDAEEMERMNELSTDKVSSDEEPSALEQLEEDSPDDDSHPTNAVRYRFTEELHSRLPQEVRDMVYNALLDDATMWEMYLMEEKSKSVNFLHRGAIFTPVAQEILTMYYSRGGRLNIMAFDLSDYLKNDFYGFGIIPSHVSLRKFHPRVCTDCKQTPTTIERLHADLQLLLNQKWANNFEISISVETPLSAWFSGYPDASASCFMWAAARAMRSFVTAMSSRGGTVMVKLAYGDDTDWEDMYDITTHVENAPEG